MNWIPALVLLVAIAAAENSPQVPAGDGALRVVLVLLVTISLVVFSRFGVRRLANEVQAEQFSHTCLANRIRWFERVQWCMWLAVAGLIVFVLQWPRVVRFDWQLDEVPFVDDLLVLGPLLLSLTLTWVVTYELHHDQRRHLNGEAVRVSMKARLGYALARLRDELVLILIPIAILLAVSDMGAILSRWTGNENWRLLAYALGIGLLVIAFPNMLRSLWRTFELPEGVLRNRLASWATKLNVRVRGVHVWDSGGRMANAAVVGILPRWRYVLLTDVLIQRLNQREVEAVALHEMAHIARRHTMWRTLVLFPPLAAWLLLQEFWPGATMVVQQHYAIGGLTLAGSIPLTIGFTCYAIVALGFISRLFEHDADLLAVEHLRRNEGDCDNGITTADFSSALRKLVAGERRRASRKSWLHPSINRRLAFVQFVSRGDGLSARRFRSRMRAICTLLALCPVLTAAVLTCRALL